VQGGFGPRLALEAGFLIALAVAAGAAQLSATTIVVIMAVAWLLVCLFELAVWAEGPRFPAWRRERAVVEEPPEAAPPRDLDEAESEPVVAAVDARDVGEGR
jgi:hypothetical protein